MAVRVEEWGKSKGHPVTGWIGVEIASHAKAGRLPLGLSSQESG